MLNISGDTKGRVPVAYVQKLSPLGCAFILFSAIVFSCGGGGGGTVDPGTKTYSISGKVSDINGNGVASVVVSFTAPGQSYTKTTAADGAYSISFQTKGTFTISAARDDFIITPASHSVTVDKAVTGINFTLNSAIIRFNPKALTVPGAAQSATVSVTVDNVTRLFAAAFTMQFDPALVEVTNVKTSGQGFLFTDSGATTILPIITTDNTTGLVTVNVAAVPGVSFQGATGSGVLAVITIQGKIAGNGTLSFRNANTGDLYLTRYTTEGGQASEPVLPYMGTVTVQ